MTDREAPMVALDIVERLPPIKVFWATVRELCKMVSCATFRKELVETEFKKEA